MLAASIVVGGSSDDDAAGTDANAEAADDEPDAPAADGGRESPQPTSPSPPTSATTTTQDDGRRRTNSRDRVANDGPSSPHGAGDGASRSGRLRRSRQPAVRACDRHTACIAARELWHRLEAVNAVLYFDDGPRQALAAAGFRGFWMGYFAARAAPMGPVAAPVVTATFFNFQPAMVDRAIPDAWSFGSPRGALDARRTSTAATLRRLLP